MVFHKQSRPRLIKTRSSENSLRSETIDSFLGTPQRSSLSDLKNPPSLHRLSTMPADVEGSAGPSSGRPRLPKRTSTSALNADAAKSVSTPTTPKFDLKTATSGPVTEFALPGLAETMRKIDVEQAINLLQELKKTASPAELVSLHKALLPTKEVSSVPPPPLSTIDEQAAYSSLSGRPRSMRPPGLATRGSCLDDPLRSQEEEAAKSAKQKEAKEEHGAWFQETMSAVHARTLSITSTGTAPDSSYSRTGGAFGLGTLRIINGGSSSPEPATVAVQPDTRADTASGNGERTSQRAEKLPKQSAEAAEARLRADASPAQAQETGSQESDKSGSAESTPLMQRRQQLWGLRTSRPVPQLSSVVLGSAHSSTAGPAKSLHQQQMTTPNGFDGGRETGFRASSDVPRFEQRWMRRASHLQNDASSEVQGEEAYELPASEKGPSIAKDDNPRERTGGSAAIAPGQAATHVASSASATAQVVSEDITSEVVTTTDPTTTVPRFSFEEMSRPQKPLKQDSGYSSEASSTPVALKVGTADKKVSKAPTTSVVTPPPKALASEAKATSPAQQSPPLSADREMPRSHEADNEAALKIPQSPSIEKKRRLSPLFMFRSRNRAEKRNSVAGDASSVPASPPAHAVPRTSSMQNLRAAASIRSSSTFTSLPASPSPSKVSSRTLQKKMPEVTGASKKTEAGKRRSSLALSRANDSVAALSISECASKGAQASTVPASPATQAKQESIAQKMSASKEDAMSMKSSRSWSRRRRSAGGHRVGNEAAELRAAAEMSASPPPSIAERRRSKSLAGPGSPMTKRLSVEPVSYTGCIRGSGGNSRGKSTPPIAELPSFPRTLDNVQPQSPGSASASVPKAMRRGSLRNNVKQDSLPKPLGSNAPTPPLQPERRGPKHSQKSVEDLFPEWRGRPASEVSSSAASITQSASAQTPIIAYKPPRTDPTPPMPELPADMDSIICRADLLMSKKQRSSPKLSPRVPTRSSFDINRKTLETLDEVPALTQGELDKLMFAQTVVNEPPIAEAPGDNEIAVEADSRPVYRHDVDSEAQLPLKAKNESKTGISHHSGWQAWSPQSAKWTQQNTIVESPAEDLVEEKVPVFSEECDESSSPSSPCIFVSKHSAPRSAESHSRRNSAEHKRRVTVHLAGRESSESDKENEPSGGSVRRSWSIISSGTVTSSNVTGSVGNISHRASTATMSSYTSNNGSTASFAGSADMASGKYVPYRPADSLHAERSRALNLARRSCQIKASELEKLRLPERRPSLPKTPSKSTADGHEGGLGYNWSRDTGVTDSAGTRSPTENFSRKSVKMSQEWGLDLTDVPVLLQRKA